MTRPHFASIPARHADYYAFLFLVLTTLPPFLMAQGSPAQPGSETGTVHVAPVVIDGKQLFLLRGITSYPAHERAKAVRERIIDVAANEESSTADFAVRAEDNSWSIYAGETLIVSIFNEDAQI